MPTGTRKPVGIDPEARRGASDRKPSRPRDGPNRPPAGRMRQPPPLLSIVDDDRTRIAGAAPDRIECLLPQFALLHGQFHHAVGEVTRAFIIAKHPATFALRGHVFSRLFGARAARNNRARRQQYNQCRYPFHPIAPVMVKSNSDARTNAAALSLCYVEASAGGLFQSQIVTLHAVSVFHSHAEKIPISCLCLVHFETDKKHRDNGRAQCTSALPYHSIHPALRRLSTPHRQR